MNSFKWALALVIVVLSCTSAFARPHPLPLRKSLNQKRVVQMTPNLLITNTGSTNMDGYMVIVSPNSTVHYANHYLFYASSQALHIITGHISKALTAALFADVKAAEPLTKLPMNHTFKSVSFGTSTYIVYGGRMTPDLSSPADARGHALAADVKNIVATLGLKNLPRRTLGH
jgi:hypothetical protein